MNSTPMVKPILASHSRRNGHGKNPHLRLGRVTHRICVHGESGSMRALGTLRCVSRARHRQLLLPIHPHAMLTLVDRINVGS